MQGLIHFLLTQACTVGHSSLIIHSGRHDGGDPWYSGRQEHTGWPLLLRHMLFGPQEDGLHGSTGIGASVTFTGIINNT